MQGFKYDTSSNLIFYNLEYKELLEGIIETKQTVSDMGMC